MMVLEVNIMKIVFFNNQKELIEYLTTNHDTKEQLWIKFDKRPTKDKLTPQQALETALCFGWIDSTIKSIDENFYIKLFTQRRKGSLWSPRNIKIAKTLIDQGLMQPPGLHQVEIAKATNKWQE